jgi:hypothetical protein
MTRTTVSIYSFPDLSIVRPAFLITPDNACHGYFQSDDRTLSLDMKISELSPGIYKLRRKEDPDGRRRIGDEIVILRITGSGVDRRYFVNQDTFGEEPGRTDFDRYFEVMIKYNGAPMVCKRQIKLQFKDSAGDHFELVVESIDELKKLFEAIPWLKVPFGYVPNKSRIVRMGVLKK